MPDIDDLNKIIDFTKQMLVCLEQDELEAMLAVQTQRDQLLAIVLTDSNYLQNNNQMFAIFYNLNQQLTQKITDIHKDLACKISNYHRGMGAKVLYGS
jgi:hypothetical protein